MTRFSSSTESGSSSGLSLAERLRAGAPEAWRDLVKLYGPLVDRWCRRAGVVSDAIPDVAQEVFVSAFRGLGGFDSTREQASFRGWLWTVARSRIVEYHRRLRDKPTARGGSTAYFDLQHVADPVPHDEPTEADEASALLHRAMEQIRVEFTEQSWSIFWRSTVLSHPTDLIAQELDVTPAAVRQAKSRILRRLRKQLGDQA